MTESKQNCIVLKNLGFSEFGEFIARSEFSSQFGNMKFPELKES